MRLPNIIARGQAALAQQLAQELEPLSQPSSPAVTVTATERKLSFELPADDARLSRGLLGIAGILNRGNAATSATTVTDTDNKTLEQPTIEIHPTVGVTVASPSERHSALALPAPIRAREHR